MNCFARKLSLLTVLFLMIVFSATHPAAAEMIPEPVLSWRGESILAESAGGYRYAINLQSTQGQRRFTFHLQSSQMTSRVVNQEAELLAPDWSLRLPRGVHHEYVVVRGRHKLVIKVAPLNKGDFGSSSQPKAKFLAVSAGVQEYLLYVTQFKADDGKVWNRLRLGFFRTRQEALEVRESLRKTFPDAWVTKVSENERHASGAWQIAAGYLRIIPVLTAVELEKKNELKTADKTTPPPMNMERVLSLIEEAEKEMTAGNFHRAILIYTRILQDPEQKERKKAQEMLALAREKNGQLTHARAEYEKFLEIYPQGEDSERVRQRLAGLITAKRKPKEKLKKQASKDRTDIFGSVSQYVYYDELRQKEGENIVSRQSLANDLVFNVRKRTAKFETRTLFVGGYEADGTSSDNETRINTFYVDANDKKKMSGRFGRQSRSTGGVLGRFDGGLFSYKAASKLTANLVGGFPVESSGLDTFETDKYFYGISFDVGAIGEYWNFSTYIINQEEAGVIDRRAAGGEIRFFHPKASFFALADYDLSFDDLNTLLFTGNIHFPNKTTVNISADYRNSPILLSNSALGGIAGRNILHDPGNLNDYLFVEDLDDLKQFLSAEEIRDIARKKNYKSSSYSLGIVKPVSTKLQLGLDAVASKQYGSEAFATSLFALGVNSGNGEPEAQPVLFPAMEETPFEYAYTMQLIGSNLVKEGDIAIISASYRDRDTQEVYNANINTRYPLSRYWRLNPRLNASFTKHRGLDSSQLKIRPLFRMDYRIRKPRIHVTFEAGAEWVNHDPDDSINTTNYFGSLGYRYDF